MEREVRYCTTEDGVRIAYCVAGRGQPLVWLIGVLASHVQREWDFDVLGDVYRAVASRFTLVRLDPRGTGLSDRDVEDLSLEARIRDLDAVVGALNLDQFCLCGESYGGLTAAVYAARYTERISRLILQDAFAKSSQFASSPRYETMRELFQRDWEMWTENVGSIEFGWQETRAREYGKFIRECTTRRDAGRAYTALSDVDVSDALSKIACPTLVIWHSGDTLMPQDAGRYLAALIPDARVHVIEARWGSKVEHRLAALGDFLGEELDTSHLRRTFQAARGAPLRTVLFTDLVGHTEMISRLGDGRGREVLREHERITREVLRAHGGTEVKTMGDGFMASFGSVTRTVECAVALQRAIDDRNRGVVGGSAHPSAPSASAADSAQDSLASTDPSTSSGRTEDGGSGGKDVELLRVRVGLNAGEPIEEEGDLFGATVILASRIAAKAEGGEILVADTVRGLCSGKGFLFADRGEFLAKGFEEPVRVYEVRWRD